MKTIDYIVATIFIAIIGIKLWILPNAEDISGIPIDLYVLHLIGWLVLIAAIGTIRFKKRNSKSLILLMLLFAFAENIWRFVINDIGLGFLLFRIFGYLFLGWLLWFWATANTTNARDNSIGAYNKSMH